MKTIDISKQFSRYPAGRYTDDGPFSGEKFRDELLIPAFASGEKVKIILDGARGYGSSFLEEAFGGMVRKGFSANDILQRIIIVSKDPTLSMEIKDYIENAGNQSYD